MNVQEANKRYDNYYEKGIKNMDYNNIILELLDRIKTLENKVSVLDTRLSNITINNNNGNEESTFEINNEDDENYKIEYKSRNDKLAGDKYIKLTNYLKSSNENCVKLTFSEIEAILGFSLKESARKYRANWSNTTTISLPCSWIKAGYKVAFVDMANEIVEFVKDSIKQENNNYPNTGDKYFRLNNYLKESKESYIKLSFKEIENILGFSLKESARKHQAFWSNTRSHSIACAWLDAGYKTINTNLNHEFVEFKKI